MLSRGCNFRLGLRILNWPAWEESILFACERLSREDPAGAQAVAATIRETLGIDPMLAAEMIFRSAPEVWTLISGEVRAGRGCLNKISASIGGASAVVRLPSGAAVG